MGDNSIFLGLESQVGLMPDRKWGACALISLLRG